MSRVVPALSLLVFTALALRLIAITVYPNAFDELEHVSYAAFLQETGRLLPRFEDQRTLVVGDMAVWDDRANYLGHPSPFYLYVSLFLDRTLPPVQAIVLPRLASAGLLLVGVAFALGAGKRHFGQDRLALLTFCALLALCPKLLAVSSQVTNDALAFLGGALAYWGVSDEARHRRVRIAIVVLGVVLAVWAKPNGGLVVAAWMCLALLKGLPHRLGLLLGLAIGLAVGVVPYIVILMQYGALVPVTVEQFGNVRQLGGLGTYLPAFMLNVGYTWSFSQTGTWPISRPGSALAIALFWSVIACAALGAWRAWRAWRSMPDARSAIAAAAPIAFALVFPIHLWFSSTTLGYSLPAASFRYYLPLWPPLAHAVAFAILSARGPWPRASLACVSAAALAVGWISP